MTARRVEAERRGRRGEKLAEWYLMGHGWRILGRRLRVSAGEVDLVARRGRTIAFVEVKWRASRAELGLAIDERRLRRVARAAEALAPRFARPDEDLRIDVLLIAPGCWPRHIVNAWQPSG